MPSRLDDLLISVKALEYREDYDELIKVYTKILELAEDDDTKSRTYNNRGVAYGKKDEHDKAIADFDQAIRLNPRYAKAFNNLGNAYRNKCEYDKAILNYDQAIELDPNPREAIHHRGVALALKNAAAAQEEITQQYQAQLAQQQQSFDEKLEDYKVDIHVAGGYKEREKEYKNEFNRTTRNRFLALRLLIGFAILGYGFIFLMIIDHLSCSIGFLDSLCTDKASSDSSLLLLGRVCDSACHDAANTSSLFQFIPPTLLVTLILSILAWIVRLINQDRDRFWALKEDAYTKAFLANIVDIDINLRPDLMKKFFDYHDNHSSTQIILNHPPPPTNPTPTTVLTEKIKPQKPEET